MKKHKMQRYWVEDRRYLYHSYKNEEALPFVLIATVICLIFYNGGIIVLAFLWCWYLIYCSINTEKLNNNPEILEARKRYEEYIWEEFHETI